MHINILKSKSERNKKKYKLDLVKLLILIGVILLVVALLYKPVTALLHESNRTHLKETILSFGFPAHLLFIVAVALQVVLSIIPVGATMPVIGGFVFGPWLGTIYTIIGVTLGSSLAFYLGRKYGRSILEDYIDPKTLKKFDKKSEEKGLITLLFIFLIPFTPDNAVCLVAGTTKMKIRNMVAVAAIGRLPGIMFGCMLGSGLGSAFTPGIIVTITAIIILVGIAYVKREQLEQKFKKIMQ